MNKMKTITIGVFITCLVTIMSMSFMKKSYSYGASSYITGNSGSYTLQFYDIDTGVDISCSAAQEFYGVSKYQRKKKSGSYVYFYNCAQISQSKYETGYPKEIADKRVADKGDSAYRVTSTESAKSAYDHIYQNHRTGKFSLEYAENETIDWNAVEQYVLTKYGVTNYKTNYYKYSVKGEWEPIRYGLPDKYNVNTGTVEIDMWRMRITGDELKVTEAFVNKLLPIINEGKNDYEKILIAYQYLKQFTTYLVDDGFANGIDSNTSVYDAFIERQTTCIGYSIAFSYLMDKVGIESYIVDQITGNNPTTEEFSSVHTYNVVKVDGKFYKLDLTGGAFLKGISNGTLSDTKLPTSTSAYNTSGKKTTWSFNKTTINGYLSSAKATKTTTTKKVQNTTTKTRTTSIKVTESSSTKSTTKSTTKKTTTTTKRTNKPTSSTTKTTLVVSDTTKPINTSNTTSTTSNKFSKPTSSVKTSIITSTVTKTNSGGIIYDPTTGNKKTTTTKTNRPQQTKPTTTILTPEQQEQRKERATINMFLVCVGITVIIVYFTYRSYIMKKRAHRYDREVDDILSQYRGR